MQLKEYQQRALAEIRAYLETLATWRKKAEDNPDLEIDFPAKAWEKVGVLRPYILRKNRLCAILGIQFWGHYTYFQRNEHDVPGMELTLSAQEAERPTAVHM